MFLKLFNTTPYFGNQLTSGELLLFSLGAVITITLFLFYYKNISKSNKNASEAPIYSQQRDILLQKKSIDGIYLTQEKNISIWTKLTIYVLVIIAIITPLYQLFGIQHFI